MSFNYEDQYIREIADHPVLKSTEIPFKIDGSKIVLVDDVLFTGRTIRAALDQIVDFGRPRTIQLAVLVDRGHRELPFRADYVGVNIPTAKDDQVVLEVAEKEGADRVFVVRGAKRKPAAKKKAATKAGE